MIPVEEAERLINNHLADWGIERVPLESAGGRILREEVVADRDFPPFDRVAMDGVALHYASWAAGCRKFHIAGQAPAGKRPPALPDPRTVVEVSTGAVLPPGTDTVVPVEQLHVEDRWVTITTETVREGQNIHRKASDRHAGETLMLPGVRLGPATMGVLATVGKAWVQVSRMPKVAILNTGDELIGVHETPEPWQIRMSNGWVVKSLLEKHGVASTLLQASDDVVFLEKTVKKILTEYNLIIITGAVSAGKHDAVPSLLPALGVKKVFHKVAQRPGKPMWFGCSDAGHTVFALPGNPLSATVCALRFVVPWLNRSLKNTAPTFEHVLLGAPVAFEPSLTLFMPGKRENNQGKLVVYPRPANGSGDLSKLLEADGFLELPAERHVFNEGDVLNFYPW